MQTYVKCKQPQGQSDGKVQRIANCKKMTKLLKVNNFFLNDIYIYNNAFATGSAYGFDKKWQRCRQMPNISIQFHMHSLKHSYFTNGFD